ncbi:MAG: type II toxin-antitoxin system VapC family toxin [Bryobacterales bacterium]|nr:type II toxin-antitoxin system VapC family toxin [Bryobacteraceae bacterium]MDW8353722.1 type II toxin-antitoxin system VapC family toxin [Bryobacterales bacterium]
MVVDTSILVAVFFNEEFGPWAADRLQENARALRMSAVNYAETLALLQDRQPNLYAELRDAIRASPIRLVPPTEEQAEIAAEARLRYPLNLGDCFAYALAKVEDCPLLTLDRDFSKTDLRVILPRMR